MAVKQQNWWEIKFQAKIGETKRICRNSCIQVNASSLLFWLRVIKWENAT